MAYKLPVSKKELYDLGGLYLIGPGAFYIQTLDMPGMAKLMAFIDEVLMGEYCGDIDITANIRHRINNEQMEATLLIVCSKLEVKSRILSFCETHLHSKMTFWTIQEAPNGLN